MFSAQSNWVFLPWTLILAIAAISIFKAPKILGWLIGRCSGFKVVAEGTFTRSISSCQIFRFELAPPFGEDKLGTRTVCCKYIYFKDRPGDETEKMCVVRNVCIIPVKPGGRIRISRNGSGKYKVEGVPTPA